MLRILILSFAILAGTMAKAQEVPEPRMMMISGGVLCDTEAQLQTLMTRVSLNNGQWPEDIPEGCGRFTPRQPIPMMVTPKYWYETPMADILFAHFFFMPTAWEQWGYIGYEPNPDYVPKPEGSSL